MSDTIDEVDPGTLRVPNSTGDNTTETYGVFYPADGFLEAGLTLGQAVLDVEWARLNNDHFPSNEGAMVVKLTIERIDV